MIAVNEEVEAGRVLLVDDHDLFREPLVHILENVHGLRVVAQAASLGEARGTLDRVDEIDVAIVDLGLPDGDGVELVEYLRATNPRCRVLILTGNIDPAQHARAVEAGAARVMHKSCTLAEIVDAVNKLIKDEAAFAEESNEILRQACLNGARDRDARWVASNFTPREREVLQALAEGLENTEIAQRLDMSIYTERTHLVHIASKLGTNTRLQTLVSAVRCGAVTIRQEDPVAAY